MMKGSGKKGEHETYLHGDILVIKTDPRIVFRGALDTLEAEVIEAQALASDAGETWYCGALGETLSLMRAIMKAEVTGAPLEPFTLFGLDEEELHKQSHNTKKMFGLGFVLPDYTMGAVAVRLNYLRARVREAEILAVRAFDAESGIITAMNRLSSAFWWLFCRRAAGK